MHYQGAAAGPSGMGMQYPVPFHVAEDITESIGVRPVSHVSWHRSGDGCRISRRGRCSVARRVRRCTSCATPAFTPSRGEGSGGTFVESEEPPPGVCAAVTGMYGRGGPRLLLSAFRSVGGTC